MHVQHMLATDIVQAFSII